MGLSVFVKGLFWHGVWKSVCPPHTERPLSVLLISGCEHIGSWEPVGVHSVRPGSPVRSSTRAGQEVPGSGESPAEKSGLAQHGAGSSLV